MYLCLRVKMLFRDGKNPYSYGNKIVNLFTTRKCAGQMGVVHLYNFTQGLFGGN